MQVSYSNRDMDLGIRFLSYEVVPAPEAPSGVAVLVQRPLIVPQLSMRSGNAQVRLASTRVLCPGSYISPIKRLYIHSARSLCFDL